jgi:hypothetical protein
LKTAIKTAAEQMIAKILSTLWILRIIE